jgi:uncharacterized protein YutE (UPF0331/DUF86 family)
MLIELDEVCFQKASTIEKTIHRIIEEYQSNPTLENLTHLDSMILNIQRSTQALIDLSLHLVSKHRLGFPKISSDSFQILYDKKLISESICKSMIFMVGFRNLAIHDYQKIDKEILHWIAKEGWKTQVEFCKELGIKIQIDF